MKRSKSPILLFFCGIFMFIPILSYAGSHPLTKQEAASGVGLYDVTVSIDWNPTQTDRTGRLKTAFEQYAKDVYMMSEGISKIRKVYVFTNSAQMNKVDIRLLDRGGRSNAFPNGFMDIGGRILTFTMRSDGSPRTDNFIGHTIAHEFGHYAYGLYDEYQEAGRSTSTNPMNPLSGDTPRDTIMNNQELFQRLSTVKDYSDVNNRKTAQWRVYSSSAWETLVRNPNDDTVPASYVTKYPRIRYAEFNSVAAPNTLTKPTSGWDSDFEIVYMGGNVAVLVIDTTGSMAADMPTRLDSAKSAAKQFVDLLPAGDSVAIIAFDTVGTTVVDVTELVDTATKNSVKNRIDSLTAGGNTSYSAGLSQAWSVLDNPNLTNRTRYVVFLSDGGCNSGMCPPNFNNFSSTSIPIYSIGLGNSIDRSMLESIATGTGGDYYEASSGSDLSNLYASLNRKLNGLDNLMDEASVNLSAGESNERQIVMSGAESLATFRGTWQSGSSVVFELLDPQGDIITSASMPQNITYQPGVNYGIFTVTNPIQGLWKSRVTMATYNGGVTQEVSSQTLLNLDLKVTGGRYPEPIGIMATVTGPEPVVGATVMANVTPPAGALAIPDIQLKDDGVAPDLMANDGIYSGVIVNYDISGVYAIKVNATNPVGNAYLSTTGALESGYDAASKHLNPFQRITSSNLTVTGYKGMASSPSSAFDLPIDNTKVWGKILYNNDAVWFKITPTVGTKYFIQTSNLISSDATTMATKMTLYKHDATTVIKSNSHYKNSNISYIEFNAPESHEYYIKVEHASPGTGTFAITAGTTSILESRGATSKSSSGSGCFINTLFSR